MSEQQSPLVVQAWPPVWHWKHWPDLQVAVPQQSVLVLQAPVEGWQHTLFVESHSSGAAQSSPSSQIDPRLRVPTCMLSVHVPLLQ
jgi:hypothetical protein